MKKYKRRLQRLLLTWRNDRKHLVLMQTQIVLMLCHRLSNVTPLKCSISLSEVEKEKDILEKEMKAVFNYFVKEEEKITSSIASLLSEISMTGYEAGAIALLKAERKLLQIRIASIYNNFKDCVNLPDINLPEVPAHERDNVTDSDEDCISFTSEHEELTVSVQSGD